MATKKARARVVSRKQAEVLINDLYESARTGWEMEDSDVIFESVMGFFDKLFKQRVKPGKPYWCDPVDFPARVKFTVKAK